MEKDYEEIFIKLTKKSGQLDVSTIRKIKDPLLFRQFLEKKVLSCHEWNKLIVMYTFLFFLLSKILLHKSGKEDVFNEVSNLLNSANFELKILSQKENNQCIQVYSKIIAHYLMLFNKSSNSNEAESFSKIIMASIAKADRIDVLDSLLFVAKGKV